MLAEHASVFTDWPMYMDHLTEAIVQALEEKGRSIKELGGRIVRSWYDPDHRGSDDDDFGYQPGAVLAEAIPYPAARALLEADPQALQVSIHAWPKSGRPGTAPWAPSVKGMLIEGIRSKPRGSVDWVFRGGAGGRPLAESEEFAVSVLEGLYDSAPAAMDLSQYTPETLREHLRENAPDLFSGLGLDKPAAAAPAVGAGTPPQGGLTEEVVQRMLKEQREELEEALEERDTDIEDRVEQEVRTREEGRVRESAAHRMIRESELPETWKQELYPRYSVTPSGVPASLLVEEEGEEAAETALKERVEADVQHCVNLINASQPGPRVRGMGATGRDPGAADASGGGSGSNAFRTFLQESGDGVEDEDVRKLAASGMRL
jgi:hypothetical protein